MGKNFAAVTTNHATLDALVAINAHLSITTEKQHTTIEYLQKENGTLRERGKSGGGEGLVPTPSAAPDGYHRTKRSFLFLSSTRGGTSEFYAQCMVTVSTATTPL